MSLKDINFGSSDGQHESKEQNFSEMFYEDGGHYTKLTDSRKYLIIGRKGTGKTTLAAYAHLQAQKAKGHISKQLFANDFIQKKLLSFSQNEINREENSLFWEYVFLLDIGQSLVDFYSKLRFYSPTKYFTQKEVIELKSLIENEHLRIENLVSNNGYETKNSGGIKVSAKPSVNLNSSCSVNESETITKIRSKYYEIIPRLTELTFNLLKKSKQSLSLYYDDMDQFEESISYDYFQSLMKNMIYSADRLNSDLWEFNSSKICLVLRKDIVDSLQHQANNLNKLVTDSGIEISWFDNVRSEPSEHPLMQMVLHKIKKSDDKFSQADLKEIYDEMFEPSVFGFLMDRSFGRPRDIIQYLNLCKNNFQESEKITIPLLKKVEQSYSEWFYNEILNELAISEHKDDIEEVFKVITKRGYPTFKFNKLDLFINSSPEYSIDKVKLFKVLSVMREYSILGTVKKRTIFDFTYRTGYSVPISEITNFVVHKGLRKYLNLP
ncbi:hypothetical protein OGZ39_01595 [Lactococcus lactis]|uniref:Uncharacterized protein n=1 Tax=Lactococcus lactis TaxID=1358 RepID=A0A9X4NAF9_9LACT|nr:hypothetical protein [Lactococcus lactis]MDG4980355.1 hypothetical protein [Lactococcus lactis]